MDFSQAAALLNVLVKFAMAAPGRLLIDELLPDFDYSAAYEICIDAPASVVYQSLLVSDFNKTPLVRVLMTLKSGKRISRNRVASDEEVQAHAVKISTGGASIFLVAEEKTFTFAHPANR